ARGPPCPHPLATLRILCEQLSQVQLGHRSVMFLQLLPGEAIGECVRVRHHALSGNGSASVASTWSAPVDASSSTEWLPVATATAIAPAAFAAATSFGVSPTT